MNIRFLFLFLFVSLTNIFAQTSISGKITSQNNEPLEGASIFFNNTTIGTISDDKGEFELKIDEGNYTLVISYLGFETKQILINTSEVASYIKIEMKEADNVLDEVHVKKVIFDNDWKYNLKQFKQAFFGRTKLAKRCKILNEKDLRFNYDASKNLLTAYSRKPLKIKHKDLGYLINYELIEFKLHKNELYFSGYAHYENLKKRISKKWKRNRQTAYNGSQMHFLRSLISKKLKEEGFIVNQFKRIKNKERPTIKEIAYAQEIIRLNGGSINFNKTKNISKPETALDSAIAILKKVSLPKYKDYLYKRNVPYKDIIYFENGNPILDFENYLMIVYTKEAEEKNYLNFGWGKKRKPNDMQTSNTILLIKKAKLDRTGITINPNALFSGGYWSFEAFANMLPLDYKPPKD